MLNFHLAGINNQNFIMKDEETGSWWQQVTGEAIFGPLKGKHLKPVFLDELTFGAWKREEPQGRVLRPDERIVASGKYAPADWEDRMLRVPVATQVNAPVLDKRELVLGITIGDASAAYPVAALQKQNPIIDKLGGTPLVIVLDEDGKSIRAFKRIIDGQEREFFLKPNSSPLRLIDDQGTEWDFTGTALTGTLAGKQLPKIAVLKDYWFDWKTYNPKTLVYTLGER
ncbi:MAG: hypothetical protein QOK48_424 [Blastocatellia bacterium]|nr:hypothetical protein [Blastocatellia bacterium]